MQPKTVEIAGFKVVYHDGIWTDSVSGDPYEARRVFFDTVDKKAVDGYSCIVIDVAATLTPELCSCLDKLGNTGNILVRALSKDGLVNDIIRLQANTKEKTMVFLVGDVKPDLFPETIKQKVVMKCKPGLTYKAVNGTEVTLTLIEYPFQGSNGMTYNADGKVYAGTASKSDLVSLVTPDNIKIMGEHEGKYYGAELAVERGGWVPCCYTQEELEALCSSK